MKYETEFFIFFPLIGFYKNSHLNLLGLYANRFQISFLFVFVTQLLRKALNQNYLPTQNEFYKFLFSSSGEFRIRDAASRCD